MERLLGTGEILDLLSPRLVSHVQKAGVKSVLRRTAFQAEHAQVTSSWTA